MKSENRVPSIQDAALRTRHSALRWGVAMKQLFSILLVVAVVVVAAIAHAQQPKKVPRIGYLSGVDAATESVRAEAFRRALRELGHIEGQNIAIEYRYAEGQVNRFLSLRPSWCATRLISSS